MPRNPDGEEDDVGDVVGEEEGEYDEEEDIVAPDD